MTSRWLMLAAACFVPAFAIAQERNWSGERIVPIRPNSEIQFSIVVEGKKTGLSLNNLAAFTCREERAGYLRIHDGRREGWVPKADFVKASEAMDYFDAQLAANPSNSHALFMRAIGWQERNEPDKAIRDYTECLRLDPKNYPALMNRANSWTAKKEYEKSIRDYDEAIRLSPKYGLAYGNRGDVRMRMKQYDKALKDFDEAIRLSPQDARAYTDRGRCRAKRQEFDKAIADFNKAIGIDSKNPYTYLDRGDVWFERLDYEKAHRDYSDAIRLDSKMSYAYNSRGRTWFAKKNFAKADEDFDQALHLAPDRSSQYFMRGITRAELKQFDKAIADFDRVSAPATMIPYARIVGHLVARKAGDEAAAKRYLDDSERASADAWPMPVIRFYRGEMTEAQLLKAAKDTDDQTEARCYVGLDHLLRGRKDEALPHLRWVKTNGNRMFIEYLLAVQQLEAIEPASAKTKKN
jgi:tetratricopeptide (TPR) repeat protein